MAQWLLADLHIHSTFSDRDSIQDHPLHLWKHREDLFGIVSLEGHEPQKGSTFSILLPVGDALKRKEVGGELTEM
jgi:hypothetical protein